MTGCFWFIVIVPIIGSYEIPRYARNDKKEKILHCVRNDFYVFREPLFVYRFARFGVFFGLYGGQSVFTFWKVFSHTNNGRTGETVVQNSHMVVRFGV